MTSTPDVRIMRIPPRSSGGVMTDDGSNNCLCSGPLKLDLEGFSASVAGHDVPLTRTEFLLLTQLVRRPYSTFSRERLAAELHNGDSNQLISLRSMDVHIARLRAKLRSAGINGIKTMRFVGYRFVPPADSAAAEPKG